MKLKSASLAAALVAAVLFMGADAHADLEAIDTPVAVNGGDVIGCGCLWPNDRMNRTWDRAECDILGEDRGYVSAALRPRNPADEGVCWGTVSCIGEQNWMLCVGHPGQLP